MKTAYIVKAYRTAVGKAPKGLFRFKRPDELAADTIKYLINSIPNLDKRLIDDIIIGNAMPEAEQGLNMGRLISLMALDTDKVAGVTINRYCASGLETIAMATAKIQSGMAECIIAGGTESMSFIPMGGFKAVPDYEIVKNGKENYYWGMGLTAEAVANEFSISRSEQDLFAFNSHKKALNALDKNYFQDEIVPIKINETYVDGLERKTRSYLVEKDEGPRKDTSIDKLKKLKAVFKKDGSVTAGNSSQMSDGAAMVLVMSEKMINNLNVKPIAKMISYSVAGVPPRIMGIGPVEAVPKALKQANLKLNNIDLIELNEAFASQSLAVIKILGINPLKINVNGGAIALGHPLGCTGTKLTVQIINEMRRRKKKYGMVTMCVGTGQGAAGIFELV
ncbi:MAG: acetyl-CoA C-acyltransferase [Bacteroidota bacterium]|nr:acetyl-CoA C-acyltransferase [Bacteroidota bacterium]